MITHEPGQNPWGGGSTFLVTFFLVNWSKQPKNLQIMKEVFKENENFDLPLSPLRGLPTGLVWDDDMTFGRKLLSIVCLMSKSQQSCQNYCL